MDFGIDDKFRFVQAFVGAEALQLALSALKLGRHERDSIYGLDAAERVAVWLYTDYQEYAVNLNRLLRNERPSPEAQNFSAVLQAAIQKLPAFKGMTYRGIEVGRLRFPRESYAMGNVVTWHAFTSTSRDKTMAYQGNVGFLIHSLSGRSLQGYSAVEIEQEVLFGPGARFRVLRCYEFSDGKLTFELEEVIRT